LQAVITDPEILVHHLLCILVALFEKLRIFYLNLAEMNDRYVHVPKRNISSYFQAKIDADTKELLQLEKMFALSDY
jgi:hypothetical protein